MLPRERLSDPGKIPVVREADDRRDEEPPAHSRRRAREGRAPTPAISALDFAFHDQHGPVGAEDETRHQVPFRSV